MRREPHNSGSSRNPDEEQRPHVGESSAQLPRNKGRHRWEEVGGRSAGRLSDPRVTRSAFPAPDHPWTPKILTVQADGQTPQAANETLICVILWNICLFLSRLALGDVFLKAGDAACSCCSEVSFQGSGPEAPDIPQTLFPGSYGNYFLSAKLQHRGKALAPQ